MNLWWGVNEFIYTTHIEQCLAHAKHPVNVNYCCYAVNICLLNIQTKLYHSPSMPPHCQKNQKTKTKTKNKKNPWDYYLKCSKIYLDSTYLYHYLVQSSSTPNLQTYQFNLVFPNTACIHATMPLIMLSFQPGMPTPQLKYVRIQSQDDFHESILESLSQS